MPEENLQPDIDALKATNAALTVKLQELESRLTVSAQQLADLRAEIANAVNLGK